MNVKILFNKSAQEALFEGIDELANAVSSTLGPKGHSVIIDKGYGIPHITKDGVTVARAYDRLTFLIRHTMGHGKEDRHRSQWVGQCKE